MESNTVTIYLGEYNKLRDFEKKVKDGKAVSIGYRGDFYFYEKDEVIEMMEERLENLQERNNKIKDPNYNREFLPKEEIRTWSLLEFIRFRKNRKRMFKQRLIKCAEKLG